MAFFITVRGIGSNNYATNKYVIFDIYISGTKEGKPVKAFITKKAYIVNGLKVKMLVEVDIMGSELINISVARKTAYIGNCGIDVLISTKLQTRNIVS